MVKKNSHNQRGFTILEMIVIMTILGILLSTGAANLWYGRKKALLDKDVEVLSNTIRQTKEHAISVRQIADIGASPTPIFNSTFLGYALHFDQNSTNYYTYEAWANAAGTPAAFSETIVPRKTKYTLEWSVLIGIEPLATPDNTYVDLWFTKLHGDLYSSQGFATDNDTVALTLRSKLQRELYKTVYISRGGVIMYVSPIPLPTATETPT